MMSTYVARSHIAQLAATSSLDWGLEGLSILHLRLTSRERSGAVTLLSIKTLQNKERLLQKPCTASYAATYEAVLSSRTQNEDVEDVPDSVGLPGWRASADELILPTRSTGLSPGVGNGPNYLRGPVTVVGPDEFQLDTNDPDNIAREPAR
jgi:hypothetical protein